MTEDEERYLLRNTIKRERAQVRRQIRIIGDQAHIPVAQLLKNGDVDEALWFMAVEEMEAREREEKFSMMMVQQNAQAQQQSAIATEEAKRQTAMQLAQIEIMKEREKANVEMAKAMELQRLKNDANYQIQQLKGKQAMEEISLEAQLESQFGNEITGRI